MSFLSWIISDARRPMVASESRIQRSETGPAEPTDLAPAPAIEEQEDGAYTIFRFQKEGATRSREAPDGGQGERSNPVAGSASPLNPGDGTTSSVERQSEERISVDRFVDEDYVSRRSDLETGKAYDTGKQSTFESDSSSSSEVSRFQKSNEQTSQSTATESQFEQAIKRHSETFEHRVDKRIRQAPGDGAPSDPTAPADDPGQPRLAPDSKADASLRAVRGDVAIEMAEPFAPNDQAVAVTPDFGGHNHEGTGASAEPSGRITPPGIAADAEAAAGPTPAASEHYQPHSRPASPRPPEALGARTAASEARVSIGQIDVVVVNARPSADAAADSQSQRGFRSRNYLRRL